MIAKRMILGMLGSLCISSNLVYPLAEESPQEKSNITTGMQVADVAKAVNSALAIKMELYLQDLSRIVDKTRGLLKDIVEFGKLRPVFQARMKPIVLNDWINTLGKIQSKFEELKDEINNKFMRQEFRQQLEKLLEFGTKMNVGIQVEADAFHSSFNKIIHFYDIYELLIKKIDRLLNLKPAFAEEVQAESSNLQELVEKKLATEQGQQAQLVDPLSKKYEHDVMRSLLQLSVDIYRAARTIIKLHKPQTEKITD